MPAAPPTNRPRSTPKIAQIPPARVDTIALRSRISPQSFDSTIRLLRSGGRKGVLALPHGVRLRVDRGRGLPEGGLEFSVPRLLTGDNANAGHVDQVIEAVRQAWVDASQVVTWEGQLEEASLMRLDLVRDFTVEGGASEVHLAGLSRIPASRARTVSYHAPDGPGVQTVYRKTTRWDTRLYLRDALPRVGESTDGKHQTVRFELQMRSTMLHERGMGTVTNLDCSDLSRLTLSHFERSRFHVPIGDPESKLRLAMAELDHLSPADRRGLLGQLQLDAIGCQSPPRDKTVQKYRRLAASNGLTSADVLQGVVAHPMTPRRLNYFNGMLEPVAAA